MHTESNCDSDMFVKSKSNTGSKKSLEITNNSFWIEEPVLSLFRVACEFFWWWPKDNRVRVVARQVTGCTMNASFSRRARAVKLVICSSVALSKSLHYDCNFTMASRIAESASVTIYLFTSIAFIKLIKRARLLICYEKTCNSVFFSLGRYPLHICMSCRLQLLI